MLPKTIRQALADGAAPRPARRAAHAGRLRPAPWALQERDVLRREQALAALCEVLSRHRPARAARRRDRAAPEPGPGRDCTPPSRCCARSARRSGRRRGRDRPGQPRPSSARGLAGPPRAATPSRRRSDWSRRSTGGPESRSRPSRRARAGAVRAAYPGVWLRDDVYATHGHYGDRHTTCRCSSGSAPGRWRGSCASQPTGRARRGLRGGPRADLRVDPRPGPEPDVRRRPRHRRGVVARVASAIERAAARAETPAGRP